MTLLHVLERDWDVMEQPVSFYVHGKAGLLLVLALAAFGLAALGLGWVRACLAPSRRALIGFGLGMLVMAAVPSDPYFPWEAPPTWPGLVHAALAVVAPLLLLWPMYEASKGGAGNIRTGLRAILFVYIAALVGCGLSLVCGFWQDRSPPLIGLAERLLATVAVAWVALTNRDEGASGASSKTAARGGRGPTPAP
jgi:hypothetical protein